MEEAGGAGVEVAGCDAAAVAMGIVSVTELGPVGPAGWFPPLGV